MRIAGFKPRLLFGWENPPLQRIRPGTRIVAWTEDCFDGAVKTPADLPSKVMAPGHDNPQTGPFFVEGGA